jgi:hypothetical protein
MNHIKRQLSLLTTTLLLAGCFGPQTYFSTVFNSMYDTYFPTTDSSDRLNMNYKVEATITTLTAQTTYEVYFFGTGLKLITVSPETKDGVATTRTLTIVYDYAEDGLFASRVYANNPGESEKVFTAFDDNSFSLFNQAVDVIETTISEEVRTIINNQATNLVIGGQPTPQDIKVYNLPVANFIDLSTFEATAGFVPSTLTVKVTYTESLNQGQFDINASGDGKTYTAVLKLSHADQLIAGDYLLSAQEKATYEGFN